jgi:purine-binding chemotaxis protein CheW
MSQTEEYQTNQYLTFTLDREVFALSIDSVREVLELTDITRIPRTPEFMRGVINLRGHAVPVVDLRRKFRMRVAEDTVNTCIIIVEVTFEGERTIMGALADSVREVVELDAGEIEAAPKMGTAVRTEFIKGMGKQNEQFIIILDVDKVFSVEELALIQGGAGEADDLGASRSAA